MKISAEIPAYREEDDEGSDLIAHPEPMKIVAPEGTETFGDSYISIDGKFVRVSQIIDFLIIIGLLESDPYREVDDSQDD